MNVSGSSIFVYVPPECQTSTMFECGPEDYVDCECYGYSDFSERDKREYIEQCDCWKSLESECDCEDTYDRNCDYSDCGCDECCSQECSEGCGGCEGCNITCGNCSDIMDSIAHIENAMASILNAEGEKIQTVVKHAASVEQILQVNNTVARTIAELADLEQTLVKKLKLVKDICYSGNKPT